jgi:hypothetical protein
MTQIPATTYSLEEFAHEFPPVSDSASSSEGSTPGSSTVNDVPLAASSCLVYDLNVLEQHIGDSTYPLPADDEFPLHRQLQSCQAVYKRIAGGPCIFSHMLVSPEDIPSVFGREFLKELEAARDEVCFRSGVNCRS